MSTTRTIQPNQDGTPLGEYDVYKPVPYPYHIDAEGNVLRQDFWRGDPSRLIGFQEDRDVQQVDVLAGDWFKGEPEDVIGMYPVFVTSDGQMYNDTRPINEAYGS